MSFDKKASSYDDWYLTPLGGFADKVETALAFQLFKARPGDLILDAGCGSGNFSLKLAKRAGSVFRRARFMTLDELEGLDRDKLRRIAEKLTA